jgi:hypothetical protein
MSIASSRAFGGIVWTHQIDFAIHAIGDLREKRKHDRDVSDLFTVVGVTGGRLRRGRHGGFLYLLAASSGPRPVV